MGKQRLSKKQRVFVNEYLQCWNATQAAIKAGYAKNSARMAGHRLVTDDYISSIIKERVEEVVMSADEALKLLSDQARGDLDDCIVIKDGEPKLDVTLLKEKGKLHLIKSITPTASGARVELYSSQRALELIAKAQGLFTDVKVEHEIKPVTITHILKHEEEEDDET